MGLIRGEDQQSAGQGHEARQAGAFIGLRQFGDLHEKALSLTQPPLDGQLRVGGVRRKAHRAEGQKAWPLQPRSTKAACSAPTTRVIRPTQIELRSEGSPLISIRISLSRPLPHERHAGFDQPLLDEEYGTHDQISRPASRNSAAVSASGKPTTLE